MILFNFIYLLGMLVSSYATYNTYRRKNCPIDSFIIVTSLASWVGVVAVIVANKLTFKKWWYV